MKIKSFSDISFILRYKLDIKDSQGNVIPFVRFLNFKLIDVIEILNSQTYTYDIDDN